MANERKIVVIADEKVSDKIISIMKKHKHRKKLTIIGRFVKSKNVFINTQIGSKRIASQLSGDQLPRIC